MVNLARENKWLIILLAMTVLFSFLPVVDIALQVKNEWRGVPSTEIYADSQYYHARMREIKDGNPFIGNPFYIEHKESLPPAFFFADWLETIPMLLGASLIATLIIDFVLWSALFVGLAYAFFVLAGITKKASAVGAFFLYLMSYISILRPVSFQIVYPIFMLFLISFVLWLKNPKNNKNILFLAFTSAFSFYTYTYLWQVEVVILGLWFLFALFKKQFGNIPPFFKAGVIALLFSLPMLVFMWKQTHQPYFWETMLRHGLVLTRLPTANVIYSGQWVIYALLLWAFLKKEDFYFKFFSVTGLGLLLISVSNVFTGKEFEISMHIEYFIALWLGLALIIFLHFFRKNLEFFKSLAMRKKIIAATLSLMCVLGIVKYFYIYSPLFFFKEDRIKAEAYQRDIQKVAGPLNWLEENEPEPKVVWASYDSPVNIFIPILTKHYVLFTEIGKVQIIPSVEQDERYLISGYFKDITFKDIKNEFVLYAGRAVAIYNPQTHDRGVKLCQLLRLNKAGMNCGKIMSPIEYQGEKYFQDLYSQYENEIKPNINGELLKFKVSYIIKDNVIDKKFHPENFAGYKKVFEDNRYEIYKFY